MSINAHATFEISASIEMFPLLWVKVVFTSSLKRITDNIDGLAQGYGDPTYNALGVPQSCTESTRYTRYTNSRILPCRYCLVCRSRRHCDTRRGCRYTRHHGNTGHRGSTSGLQDTTQDAIQVRSNLYKSGFTVKYLNRLRKYRNYYEWHFISCA